MVSGDGDNNRAEADQWLATSEKLLASSDFHGAKTFAIRACEADPSRTDAADYIVAIADTLLALETTIGDSKVTDWYAVLRLSRLTQNPEHVATQYRRLTLLLNPNVNRLPFADQALKLVSDACYSQSEQFQDSPLQSQGETMENPTATSFWTACPYCFSLFEYPKGYEECTLRCQQCRKAFEAVKTQTPPVESNGEGVYFCSWAMFPVGLSSHAKTSNWSPISHLSVCTGQRSCDQQSKALPRNHDADDVDIYITISDDD
ncbi:uncharacterized protein LOC9309478 isoform X2 [Arabidopsis lyrata subsp. lyrata]|uniref:uncharacterized protein LOC9309478 isoform X2 n=1 Tax=Arabidopsis lyrata subsp. lyrata TaxID=81972 RepID=UPI000A29DCEC|nr:uncharacterized protein LOC9309478 isoform X2 [Arabidopsis lyrata subsp. lyrata]|eukprot:XP_020877763.1 uncharacterized protein LOC9309478 isoform X2 [Arabidopsis lyrata subsp. lyrata]